MSLCTLPIPRRKVREGRQKPRKNNKPTGAQRAPLSRPPGRGDSLPDLPLSCEVMRWADVDHRRSSPPRGNEQPIWLRCIPGSPNCAGFARGWAADAVDDAMDDPARNEDRRTSTRSDRPWHRDGVCRAILGRRRCDDGDIGTRFGRRQWSALMQLRSARDRHCRRRSSPACRVGDLKPTPRMQPAPATMSPGGSGALPAGRRRRAERPTSPACDSGRSGPPRPGVKRRGIGRDFPRAMAAQQAGEGEA